MRAFRKNKKQIQEEKARVIANIVKESFEKLRTEEGKWQEQHATQYLSTDLTNILGEKLANIEDKIKKGLECCALNDGIACKDCPYNAEYNSHCADEQMCKDALTLITEQEKEIEQLKFNISQAQDQILATAQDCQEYREQQVKQAMIDFLNENLN